MLFSHHLLALLLSLRLLECAEFKSEGTENVTETIADTVEGEICSSPAPKVNMLLATFMERVACSEQTDMFSRYYISDDLFQKILQYVAKSPGKMAMTSSKFYLAMIRTEPMRFYQGLCWDMPEIADIYESAMDLDALNAEMEVIESFKDAEYERSFNEGMYLHLFEEKSFKIISTPIFKYLIRMFLTGQEPSHKRVSDMQFGIQWDLYVYAGTNGFYDIFFEMKKTLDLFIQDKDKFHKSYNSSDVIFDYHNWVYDNPRARDYVLDRMTSLTTTGGIEIIHSDIQAWFSVCIHREAPDSFYIDFFKTNPSLLIINLQNYLIKSSPITLGPKEMENRNTFFLSLVHRLIRRIPDHAQALLIIELLKEVRYGLNSPEIYDKIIDKMVVNGRETNYLAEFVMAASRANKKDLVLQLSRHPKFDIYLLDGMVETNNPQSFKVLYDIFEGTSNRILNDTILTKNYGNFVPTLTGNKFRIASATTFGNGTIIFVESPEEYVKLGFSPAYRLELENRNLHLLYLPDLKSKMLNEAADSGIQEFKTFITTFDHDLFRFSVIKVSQKVVKLLLENVELINFLRARGVKVYCFGLIVAEEIISLYSDVISLL